MPFFNRLFFKPPTKDEFAKAVLDGIKRASEKRAVVYDKDQFALRTPEKDGGLLNLTNAYPEFCGTPEAKRPEVVKKWVRVWFAHRMDRAARQEVFSVFQLSSVGGSHADQGTHFF
jgi:hypothetical protein